MEEHGDICAAVFGMAEKMQPSRIHTQGEMLNIKQE